MEFRILGPLEVWDGGRQLEIPGAKQRALLALLLLHANQVVPTDRLVDELWDTDSHQAGPGALRVRIHELRKTLGGDDSAVLTRAPGYLIRLQSDDLDLHRFERLLDDGRRSLEASAPGDATRALDEALGLWRGPPLADVSYERFAQPVVARLEELRLVGLELRVEAQLTLGRHAELIGPLNALVGEHPLRERFHALRMLALYRAGRQGEALDAYRAVRESLAGGLGLEPSAPLRQLERAILSQDPSLDLPSAPASTVRPTASRAILVAGREDSQLEELLTLAEPLAADSGREIILARLVPDAASLAQAAATLSARAAALTENNVVARAAVHTSDQPGADLVRLATEQDVDLLLLCAPPSLSLDGVPGEDLARVLSSAPCDVAIQFPGEQRRDGPVLVPFGGVDHDWAAVELAAWVARARRVPLRLLGATAVPERGKRDASRLLSHASLVVQRGLGIAAEPMLVDAGEEGILAATADAGVLVAGLSHRWPHEGLGAARLALVHEVRSPLLLVRKGVRPGGLAPRAGLTRFTWSVRAAA